MHDSGRNWTAPAISDWLIRRVADYLSLDVRAVDPRVRLAEYGLDSLFALGLCGDIEEEFGVEMEPTLAWDYPTVKDITAFLVELSAPVQQRSA